MPVACYGARKDYSTTSHLVLLMPIMTVLFFGSSPRVNALSRHLSQHGYDDDDDDDDDDGCLLLVMVPVKIIVRPPTLFC